MIIDAIPKSFRVNGATKKSYIEKGNLKKGDFASHIGYVKNNNISYDMPLYNLIDYVQINENYAVMLDGYERTETVVRLIKRNGNSYAQTDSESIIVGDTFYRSCLALIDNTHFVVIYLSLPSKNIYSNIYEISGDTLILKENKRLYSVNSYGGSFTASKCGKSDFVISWQDSLPDSYEIRFGYVATDTNKVTNIHNYKKITISTFINDAKMLTYKSNRLMLIARNSEYWNIGINGNGIEYILKESFGKGKGAVNNTAKVRDGFILMSLYDAPTGLNTIIAYKDDKTSSIVIGKERIDVKGISALNNKIFAFVVYGRSSHSNGSTRLETFDFYNNIIKSSGSFEIKEVNEYIKNFVYDGKIDYIFSNFGLKYNDNLIPYNGANTCVCMQDGNVGETIKVVDA